MNGIRISLRGKIIFTVIGITLPVILLLFFLNTYAIKKSEQQIYHNIQSILDVHVKELEAELNKASGILIKESIKKGSIYDFSSFDQERKYQAIMNYQQENKERMQGFHSLEGQIAYSPKNENSIVLFNDYGSDYKMRRSVFEYVRDHMGELTELNGQWRTYRIGDEWILLSAAGNENIIFCFWTTYDVLMKPVQGWELPVESKFCFTGKEGQIYTKLEDEELENLPYDGDLNDFYFAGNRNKYLISGTESAIGDFRLMNVVEKKACIGILGYMEIVITVLLFIVLGIGIPFIIHILNKSIFAPVDKILNGINEVEKGNLSVRIENQNSSKEMEHLIDSFNEMVGEIHNLKIDSYEESLERKQLELDYMNLQMKPHFYLNALNVISVTAQVGDTEMVNRITKHLAQYMRYIMGSRKKYVLVKEELLHVSHYLKIMEIRMGEDCHYEENVDPELLDIEIPPLMIQTLLENSMKYALDVYGKTIISLTIKKEGDRALIQVKDNGNGYSEEYLERYNKRLEAEGNHIGIMNLRSRLEMMYGEDASIHLYNLEPKGACTEIRIKL